MLSSSSFSFYRSIVSFSTVSAITGSPLCALLPLHCLSLSHTHPHTQQPKYQLVTIETNVFKFYFLILWSPIFPLLVHLLFWAFVLCLCFYLLTSFYPILLLFIYLLFFYFHSIAVSFSWDLFYNKYILIFRNKPWWCRTVTAVWSSYLWKWILNQKLFSPWFYLGGGAYLAPTV